MQQRKSQSESGSSVSDLCCHQGVTVVLVVVTVVPVPTVHLSAAADRFFRVRCCGFGRAKLVYLLFQSLASLLVSLDRPNHPTSDLFTFVYVEANESTLSLSTTIGRVHIATHHNKSNKARSVGCSG